MALQLITRPGDLQPMRFNGKPEFVRHLVFDLFNLRTVEFHNLLAILTNDVVVVGVLGVVRIVEHVVLAEIHLADQAAFGQQWQRAINGCARNRFVTLLRPVEELVGRKMLFRAENRIHDGLALRSQPKAFRLQKFDEPLFSPGFGVFSHGPIL